MRIQFNVNLKYMIYINILRLKETLFIIWHRSFASDTSPSPSQISVAYMRCTWAVITVVKITWFVVEIQQMIEIAFLRTPRLSRAKLWSRLRISIRHLKQTPTKQIYTCKCDLNADHDDMKPECSFKNVRAIKLFLIKPCVKMSATFEQTWHFVQDSSLK